MTTTDADDDYRADRASTTETGIYVRAKVRDAYRSVDISSLTLPSLLRWLRSRGGQNLWAEYTVAQLLGHDRRDIDLAMQQLGWGGWDAV